MIYNKFLHGVTTFHAPHQTDRLFPTKHAHAHKVAGVGNTIVKFVVPKGHRRFHEEIEQAGETPTQLHPSLGHPVLFSHPLAH